MKKLMLVMLASLLTSSVVQAALFSETCPLLPDESGAYLEESWIIHPAGHGATPGPNKNVGTPPGGFLFTNTGWGEQAAYADGLVLPASYAYDADIATLPLYGRGKRFGILFNAQETGAYLPSNGYELFLYDTESTDPNDHDPHLYLISWVAGGYNELANVEASVLTDTYFHNWKVDVQRVGGNNEIRVYLDGALVTWTAGVNAGNSVVIDSSHTGGTIGLYGVHERENVADNITVIPEPVSLLLLALGAAPFVRRRK